MHQESADFYQVCTEDLMEERRGGRRFISFLNLQQVSCGIAPRADRVRRYPVWTVCGRLRMWKAKRSCYNNAKGKHVW